MADSGGLESSSAGGPVELGAVPETLLWTLYHRASEARRPDPVLHDPLAVDLLERIDFPFEQRFGKPRASLAQWQALRARCFDLQIARFLARSPGGTVVALGEGLETQFWRVDNGTVQWLGVDLPETVELRRRLLPSPDRHRLIACSVLDDRWLDAFDPAADVLVTAQGLLMYLEPEQVHTLLMTCARRLPRGAIVFDAVSRGLSQRSRRGKVDGGSGYRPPPWTWGVDRAERRRLAHLPGIEELRLLRLPRGRGVLFGVVLPLLATLPPLRGWPLGVLTARLSGAAAAPRGRPDAAHPRCP